MKPIMVTRQVEISWADVVRSVEPNDLGLIFSSLANNFAGDRLGFFTVAEENHDGRRKAVIELHAALSEPAKRMLAEVVALEFARSAPAQTPQTTPSETTNTEPKGAA